MKIGHLPVVRDAICEFDYATSIRQIEVLSARLGRINSDHKSSVRDLKHCTIRLKIILIERDCDLVNHSLDTIALRCLGRSGFLGFSDFLLSRRT